MRFHPRTKWWIYGILLLTAACMLTLAAISGAGRFYIAIFAVCFLIEYLFIAGQWYEVTDSKLVVYRLYSPTAYPIDKIKSIKVIRKEGTTRSPRRIAITFTDKTARVSGLPLEISPKDHEGFIKLLQSVNQNILVE